MNVSLTPELEAIVNQKVESGLYNSASEVVREALRLLSDQDELKKIRLEELRGDINKGLDSLRRGQRKPMDIEAVKAEGRKQLSAKRGKK
jgi:antitoxin ParD1/3/4